MRISDWSSDVCSSDLLRDLLSRAAAVIEDPTSESADDRETLVEDLTEAASQVERFELVPIPKNDVERFRIMLKNEKEVALYTKMVELAGRDPEYDKRFQQYIREGSTLELRELARPFGPYWKDPRSEERSGGKGWDST